MGWVYNNQLKSPGQYLLGILKTEKSVPFSRFYNRDTDYAALAKDAGIPERDEEQAHVLIEFAAQQLEDAGIVSFTTLDAKLIDEENDFLITLTEKGEAFLASNESFKFRDMDL